MKAVFTLLVFWGLAAQASGSDELRRRLSRDLFVALNQFEQIPTDPPAGSSGVLTKNSLVAHLSSVLDSFTPTDWWRIASNITSDQAGFTEFFVRQFETRHSIRINSPLRENLVRAFHQKIMQDAEAVRISRQLLASQPPPVARSTGQARAASPRRAPARRSCFGAILDDLVLSLDDLFRF